MSVMPSKKPAKYFPLQWKMFNIPILALAFSASGAWAQAPAVVIDAQQNIGPPTGDPAYGQPEAIAVAPNGTVYIADTNNNRILGLKTNLPGTSFQLTVLNTTFAIGAKGYTLSSPQALAVDAAGDLYIGDVPSTGGRIFEMTATGGVLTGTVKLIYSGAPLINPTALAVDSNHTLFIGDYPPSTGDGAIYSLAAGGSVLKHLIFTGIPADYTPAALVRDSSGNLYIADNGGNPGGDNVNGNVYKAPDAGGIAHAVSTQTFIIDQPSGLALDTAGDLFILTKLANDTGAGQQVVEIPFASPTTPYIIPNTGLGNSSSMALDPNGNLDVLQLTNGVATQLAFVTPVNLGSSISVGATGTPISFNVEFNAPATFSGFRALTQGDPGGEVTVESGGTCSTVPATVSPYMPYTCAQAFAGSPQYPGTRISAIQVEGASPASILGSSSVYETGTAAAEVTYPLDSTVTADSLQQPQGVAISGLNHTVYIADSYSGKVYSTPYLTGTTFTPVSTGTFVLSAPSAVALDGQGDLYIADFNLAEVIKVPTTSGLAPSLVATGGLLKHPIALAIDYLGNLYIGDAGPNGDEASIATPGYVVKVPVSGSPSKITIPSGIKIIFPQALATDSEANLLIGDGGADVVPSDGQIVKVTAAGTAASVITAEGVTSPTNPVGLAFDAAGQLYALDGTVGTLTVIPPTGNGYQMAFSTTLSGPSALAASAGTQSFVISSVGNGTSNSLVYLNGNSSTLAFDNVGRYRTKTLSATVLNIGNEDLTLGSPFLEEIIDNPAFTISAYGSGTTCTNGGLLDPAASCVIGVNFTPTAIGFTSEEAAVESNAYNNGIPVVNFTGTGTTGTSVRKPGDKEAKPFTGPRGRKSFQAAGRQARSEDDRDQGAH